MRGIRAWRSCSCWHSDSLWSPLNCTQQSQGPRAHCRTPLPSGPAAHQHAEHAHTTDTHQPARRTDDLITCTGSAPHAPLRPLSRRHARNLFAHLTSRLSRSKKSLVRSDRLERTLNASSSATAPAAGHYRQTKPTLTPSQPRVAAAVRRDLEEGRENDGERSPPRSPIHTRDQHRREQ